MSFLRTGFCVLLAFSVLAFGAVEEWAQAVLEIGFSLLFVWWAAYSYQRKSEQMYFSPLLFPLGAFAFVVAIQLGLHRTVSPYHTRVELQLVFTYLLALFLMSQAFQRASHWKSFVWFLMSLGFFVSIFGILQHLTFNGKLYWARTMRYGGYPFGPYVNRNHFAGFAEILIPIALVPLVLGKVRRERLVLVGLFAIVPTVALLLSASRGGIVSFGVEMVILFLLLLVRRIRGKHVLLGGLVVLSAVMAVSWIGVQQVLQRFSEFRSAEVTSNKRASMRHDTFRVFLDKPILGTGLGTLPVVFPAYDSLYDGKFVNHSHNDYLETLADTGVLGALCCAWFISVLFVQGLRGLANLGSSFGAALNLSGLVGCSGFLVHSLVDFNLHIPANALLFFVAAQMATARLKPTAPGKLEGPETRQTRRKRWSGHTRQTVY
jgi:O-antigen ligase